MQLVEESLFWLVVSEGGVHHGRQEAWQEVVGMGSGTGSGDITYSSRQEAERENRKCRKVMNFQCLPSILYFLPYGCTVFPKCTSN